jgi:hypothetical protein
MFSLGMRAASTQAPAPPQAQRAGARAPRLTTEQWPWYPVDPPLRAGHTEEERVIYARPPTVSPKVYWAAAGVCISGFVMYFTIPSVAEARALLENPEDER